MVVNDGSFGFDGFSHPAMATAVGVDGATPIDGTFTFTYNGSPDEPTAPGTYAVVATFTSNTSDYANTIAAGTIVVGTESAPSTTITVGTTGTYTLSGIPTGGGLSHIINNSTAGTGLNVVAANQVGIIEGTGNTTVGDGSSLTANSIVQGSLVIGGSAGNPATVTIAASDASGNPVSAATSGSSAATTALATSTGSAAVQSVSGDEVQDATPAAGVVAFDIANIAASSTPNTAAADVASSMPTSAPGTVADPSNDATCGPATTAAEQAAGPSTSVELNSASATAPRFAGSVDSTVNAGRSVISSSDLLPVIDSIFADDFGSDSPGPLSWMHHHPRL